MRSLTDAQKKSQVEIIWAIVLLQGAVLVLVSIEALLAAALSGFVVIGPALLTLASATATLIAARGLRQHKRWARRLTLVGESVLLAIGAVEMIGTAVLAGTTPGIMPMASLVVIPISVVVLLRRTRSIFVTATAAVDVPAEVIVEELV